MQPFRDRSSKECPHVELKCVVHSEAAISSVCSDKDVCCENFEATTSSTTAQSHKNCRPFHRHCGSACRYEPSLTFELLPLFAILSLFLARRSTGRVESRGHASDKNRESDMKFRAQSVSSSIQSILGLQARRRRFITTSNLALGFPGKSPAIQIVNHRKQLPWPEPLP